MIFCITFGVIHAQDQRDEARRRVFGRPTNNSRSYQTSHTTVHTKTYSRYPAYSSNNHRKRHYKSRRYESHKIQYYKHDNGRHLGWEKGKGNPHKTERYHTGHED